MQILIFKIQKFLQNSYESKIQNLTFLNDVEILYLGFAQIIYFYTIQKTKIVILDS